ncbi:L-threonylcarbamoyladenylate synthase [Marinomonas pollencensis]|uniref:Threonylcarbamoyl-AMP synthase n=1 Tax=Marinomonas pollencensis TaxID=491954 RepID=A0A3E0DJ67_9GAMM|nr:Sua5/YciO/YrdC/YwlC family protein [Marinomonas pollencensis]REG82663.1 L-threonylcarbamoyladenylate synthase [Marinomonas pollencensis]
MKLIHSPTQLADIVRQGGVIAYPTEAVWGLGCDPFNESAVKKILSLKSRAIEKGLILVAGNAAQLAPWTETLTTEAAERLISKTAIPTSWVVPDTQITPPWVRGQHASVAIRLSQHAPVQALCAAFNGTLVSTSANPAGLDPAMSKEEVIAYFGDGIDAIYDAPLGGNSQPSQVKDLLSDTLFRA